MARARGRHESLARDVEQRRDDAQVGHVAGADLTVDHGPPRLRVSRPLRVPRCEAGMRRDLVRQGLGKRKVRGHARIAAARDAARHCRSTPLLYEKRAPGRSLSRPKSPATWRSGYAAVCKTVYAGSIPAVASTLSFRYLRPVLAVQGEAGLRLWYPTGTPPAGPAAALPGRARLAARYIWRSHPACGPNGCVGTRARGPPVRCPARPPLPGAPGPAVRSSYGLGLPGSPPCQPGDPARLALPARPARCAGRPARGAGGRGQSARRGALPEGAADGRYGSAVSRLMRSARCSPAAPIHGHARRGQQQNLTPAAAARRIADGSSRTGGAHPPDAGRGRVQCDARDGDRHGARSAIALPITDMRAVAMRLTPATGARCSRLAASAAPTGSGRV